jgi:stage II sporulation protein R
VVIKSLSVSLLHVLGGINMKKLFLLGLCLVLVTSFVLVRSNDVESENMSDKLIRFHVIANSDLNEDQEVKLRVRDAILEDVGPKLSKSGSRDESLKILEENLTNIESIANRELSKEGEKYRADAILGNFNFPIKKYGTITLPAGEYKALRIVLGDGEGKNWWCVMFPPLCFIDITRGLTSEKTDRELKKVLDDEEVESITAFKQQSTNSEVVAKESNNVKSTSYHDKQKTSTGKTAPLKSSIQLRFRSVEVMEKIKYMFNK